MILADFDGNLLFYVIAAVIGLISWLTKKDEHGSEQQTPTATPKFPRPKRSGPEKSEEERLRKYLDALGIPEDQRPPMAKRTAASGGVNRPVATPPDLRGQAAPPSRSAPTVTRPQMAPAERGQSPPLPRRAIAGDQAARTLPPPVPAPASPRKSEEEWAALDEQGAPTIAVEQLHVPELVTPHLPELVTTSSSVTAIPSDRPATGTPIRDAYEREGALPGELARQRVRALLQSGDNIRAAILVREILGRAPGLPTQGSLPTFP
jgi:hypothetical protein